MESSNIGQVKPLYLDALVSCVTASCPAAAPLLGERLVCVLLFECDWINTLLLKWNGEELEPHEPTHEQESRYQEGDRREQGHSLQNKAINVASGLKPCAQVQLCRY